MVWAEAWLLRTLPVSKPASPGMPGKQTLSPHPPDPLSSTQHHRKLQKTAGNSGAHCQGPGVGGSVWHTGPWEVT